MQFYLLFSTLIPLNAWLLTFWITSSGPIQFRHSEQRTACAISLHTKVISPYFHYRDLWPQINSIYPKSIPITTHRPLYGNTMHSIRAPPTISRAICSLFWKNWDWHDISPILITIPIQTNFGSTTKKCFAQLLLTMRNVSILTCTQMLFHCYFHMGHSLAQVWYHWNIEISFRNVVWADIWLFFFGSQELDDHTYRTLLLWVLFVLIVEPL